jgi:uncharacterized OB-fold protein
MCFHNVVSELRTALTTLEFPYTRSTGPVIGAFLAGLQDGRILANRASDGRVLCPPLEYDPVTAARLDPPSIEVGPGATVSAWTWVAEPTSKHPLNRQFAFAMVRLDGADTALVHAVDAGSPEVMAQGMRVVARFRPQRRGMVTDIEAFVPEGS